MERWRLVALDKLVPDRQTDTHCDTLTSWRSPNAESIFFYPEAELHRLEEQWHWISSPFSRQPAPLRIDRLKLLRPWDSLLCQAYGSSSVVDTILMSPLWADPQHRPVWARCRPSVWGRTAPPHRKSQSRGLWRHRSPLCTQNTGEGLLRGLQESKHQQHRNRCHKTNIVHIFSLHQNNILCFRCCFNEADSIVLLWAEYWICYSRERHL